jgi:hypothetical protein
MMIVCQSQVLDFCPYMLSHTIMRCFLLLLPPHRIYRLGRREWTLGGLDVLDDEVSLCRVAVALSHCSQRTRDAFPTTTQAAHRSQKLDGVAGRTGACERTLSLPVLGSLQHFRRPNGR